MFKMNIDIAIKIIIPIIGAVVTYILVPWIKEKTTKEQRDNLTFWIEVAVLAVEKYYKGQSQKGDLKKEYVIDFIVNQGFNISEDQLSILIDAVVEEVINKPKELFDQG